MLEVKGSVAHKNTLTKQDLVKLYSSFALQTPKGPQDKIFVDYAVSVVILITQLFVHYLFQ